MKGICFRTREFHSRDGIQALRAWRCKARLLQRASLGVKRIEPLRGSTF